jgi:hypothetical protein
VCNGDGTSSFTIINVGSSAAYGIIYEFYSASWEVMSYGYFDLGAGESTVLTIDVVDRDIILSLNHGLLDVYLAACLQPTRVNEPTVMPTFAPTFTPTSVPTAVATTLACQKNNPTRLDCSSLQVTATCQGNIAIFTITNTGERGNGDMRAATEYRLIKNNTIIQTGSVQLLGNATTQILYSGGGRITLEVDQQMGYPGKSQPQATINCSR